MIHAADEFRAASGDYQRLSAAIWLHDAFQLFSDHLPDNCDLDTIYQIRYLFGARGECEGRVTSELTPAIKFAVHN